ncbi:hypothetical protein Thiosp_01299 [Thiorhodovibrio litoralis]|nr:hypothetical protein Thiosp_01299 [Thiorhodovibrio litoralis]
MIESCLVASLNTTLRRPLAKRAGALQWKT